MKGITEKRGLLKDLRTAGAVKVSSLLSLKGICLPLWLIKQIKHKHEVT